MASRSPLDRNALAARAGPCLTAVSGSVTWLVYGAANKVWHVRGCVGEGMMVDASAIRGHVGSCDRSLTSPDRRFGRLHYPRGNAASTGGVEVHRCGDPQPAGAERGNDLRAWTAGQYEGPWTPRPRCAPSTTPTGTPGWLAAEETRPPTPRRPWPRRPRCATGGGCTGGIGVALAALWKLKVLAVLVKLKFFTVAGSMALSIVAYSWLFGWTFTVGFVLLILVHELGHVVVLRARGIKAGAPVFIPFMGAFVSMKEAAEDGLRRGAERHRGTCVRWVRPRSPCCGTPTPRALAFLKALA